MRWNEAYPKAYGQLEGVEKMRMQMKMLEAEAKTLEGAAARRLQPRRGRQRFTPAPGSGLQEAAAEARGEREALAVRLDGSIRGIGKQIGRIDRPMDRLVLRLRYVTGMNAELIRLQLGLSVSGYYRILDRGFAALEQILEAEHDDRTE